MMRILIVLTFFSITTLASAQSKAEKQVAAAITQLKEALISGDRELLDAITSEQLHYGHSNGRLEDKTSFLEALVSGRSDFISIDLSDQSIVVKGKTATVRHNLKADILDNGVPNTIQLHILTVWIKEKGKWKLLARQSAKI
jgi:ketosteroid isomerase-like protein